MKKYLFALVLSLVAAPASAAFHTSPYGSSAVVVAIGKQSGTNEIRLIYHRVSDSHCTVTILSTSNTLPTTTATAGPAQDQLYMAGNARPVSIWCSNTGIIHYLVAAGNPNKRLVSLEGAGGHDLLYCWSENGICRAYGRYTSSSTDVEHDYFESRGGLTTAGWRNAIYGMGGNDAALVDVSTDIDMGPGDDCLDSSIALPIAANGGTGIDKAAHWPDSYGSYINFETSGACWDPPPPGPHPVHGRYCCMGEIMASPTRVDAKECREAMSGNWDFEECAPGEQEVDCGPDYSVEILNHSGPNAGDLTCY